MYKTTIKYCMAAAIALIAAAFCACGSRSEEIISIENEEPVETQAVSQQTADEPARSLISVYVCGAVKRPDVYELAKGIRVVDAVEAAGGFANDAGYEYLNLAEPVTDGQKIYIPTRAEIEGAIAAGEGLYASTVNITSNSPGIRSSQNPDENNMNGGEGSGGKVNINYADRSTLMTLPGIGASKADKIINYRQANGGFSSIEDIMLVDGIKEGLYNKVKDSICVN